jgi:hypothetical protein
VHGFASPVEIAGDVSPVVARFKLRRMSDEPIDVLLGGALD